MRRALSLVLLPVFTAAGTLAATGYHVIKEVKIGGDGGWDYLTLDGTARRLYVSHETERSTGPSGRRDWAAPARRRRDDGGR